jgi:uncharacterized protein
VKRVIRVTIALGLIGLLATGCGSFFPKPRPDSSRIFVLFSPLEATQRQDSDHSGQISLGVGPVRLPGYLDRREIVTRVARDRFDLSENDRWAGPLDENLTHVLAQNLSVLLGSDRIIAYPWPIDKRPHYRVEIQVLRFESNSAREAELSARWAVIDETGKEAPNLKESRLARPAKENSTDGSVAALSETVADLSREIAKTVISVDGQREPESRSPSGSEGSGKDFSLRSK